MLLPLIGTAELPNLYNDYPEPRNISEGIYWPAGQALPTFATPDDHLDVVHVQDLTEDEEILFSALQGLVNKTKPRLYLLDEGADEGTYTWANTSTVGLDEWTRRVGDTLYSPIVKYAEELDGLVLYDPGISPHYRNLAGTVAGLRNVLPVTPELHQKLRDLRVPLNVIVDLTDLTYTSPVDIYNYLYETYWPECEKRLIVSARPHGSGGDYHHTRDIAAATGSAVVWLDTLQTSERAVLQKFFGDMPAGNAIALGWYQTERSGIRTATEFGIGTLPADFYISGTVYGGSDHTIQIPPVPRIAPLKDKVYIAVFISDGDNIQYTQRAMRKIWDQHASNRGRVAMNWTIAPGLVDIGPGLLNYYYTTATPNDGFVTGPSGMGYIMPCNTLWESGAPAGDYLTDAKAMAGYARQTDVYLQRSGLRVVTIWDNATTMQRASYERHGRNLYGATVQQFGGFGSVSGSVEGDRLPFERLIMAYAGSYPDMLNSITDRVNDWNGDAPLFLSYQVSIWDEMKPNRIVDLSNELRRRFPRQIEFVRADHYFNLQNEARDLPHNLTMSTDTEVSASHSAATANRVVDGTPVSYWSAQSDGAAWLKFDFNEVQNLNRYIIRHAGSARLPQEWNSRDFRVQVSLDGELWTTVDAREDEQLNVTDVEFDLVSARYLRILIQDPGADGVARVADVEIYGRNALEILLPVPDESFENWINSFAESDQPPEGQRGPHDQPMGDGMTNLEKYAYGINPMTNAGGQGPRLVTDTSGGIAVELSRSKQAAIEFRLEESIDLTQWTVVEAQTELIEDLGEHRERVRLIPADRDASARFFRLRITGK